MSLWTQRTRTPRARASRLALRRPARDSSRAVTRQPRLAKNTLSRPSPQPSSSTRAPRGRRRLTRLANEDGAVPHT